jgi:hypothetical protein
MNGVPSVSAILTNLNARRFVPWIIVASLIPAYPEATDILLEKKLNPDKAIDPAKVWSGVRN